MTETKQRNNRYQSGAVSIFLVIFFALLATVVTVGFVRLMTGDQRRASDLDLSQSAYDSAMAGVEDAKRALVRYSTADDSEKAAIKELLSKCNGIDVVINSLNPPSANANRPDSVDVVARNDTDSLQQSYTCAKVQLETDEYEGYAAQDTSVLVPLKATDAYDRVQIRWFSKKDLENSGQNTVELPESGTDKNIDKDWADNRPPILETQLIQTAANFRLEGFDDGNNTRTLFLYPLSATRDFDHSFISDARRTANPSQPYPVKCERELSSGGYSCSTIITIPDPDGGSRNMDNTFLRLVARSNSANYEIKLLSGTDVVRFDGVQPKVDVTGRANDVYRRVRANVEVGASVIYPDAALDVSGNICKTFSVTDKPEDYSRGDCNP